jgi:hypothetical protein
MARIRRKPVLFPRPLRADPPVQREIHVPAKDVRFFPGVYNTKRYGDGAQMPDLYLGTAEDPQMGYGAFTTRDAQPGTFLMHYGVEIPEKRAKELSRKV